MVAMTQEEILLSLIQGDEGKKWAVNRIGWKESSKEQGENGEDNSHLYAIYHFTQNKPTIKLISRSMT